MDLRKVKAVLFDLDGTLLDTVNDIGTCVNETMCRYGFPARDLKDYPALVGHGARELIRISLPEGLDEETIEKVFKDYVLHYRDNCDRFVQYYPGVREFLSFLTEKGYKIGVITNKSQPTAEKIVGKYLADYDFAIMWGNNYVRPLKPSLESAQLACETLGLKPEEIMFVGDGDTDMEFGSKAGFTACGVTWGYRSKEVLLEYGADFLVDSFAELQKKFQ